MKFILIFSLGITYCLKKKVVSLEEAEKYIFYPYLVTCELEDVKDLIPDEFNLTCDDIIKTIFKKLKELKNVGVNFNYILENNNFFVNKKVSL